MTATERFKMLLASALERVCVLEEQLEQAQAELAELRSQANGSDRAVVEATSNDLDSSRG